MIKTVVNEEKEMFFGSLWIFPLIPISAIFVLSLVNGYFAWFLFLVFVVWFCVLVWIYYCVHETITIQEEHFVLLRKKKRTFLLKCSHIRLKFIYKKSYPKITYITSWSG